MTFTAHPFAELFPLILGAEFDELVEDIRVHGVRERITILEQKILDGRNRYRALEELIATGEVLGAGWGHRAGERLTRDALDGPKPWFCAFNAALDGDALAWVLSKNLKRRHLDESQRAMVAARIANLKQGRPEKPANLPVYSSENPPTPDPSPPQAGGGEARVTQADAARMLNVSERAIRAAKAVQGKGAADLVAAVEQGKVAVSAAEAIATLPQDQQSEIVARGEKEILAEAKIIRARQRAVRFEQVNAKLAEISKNSGPLPTAQKYPIIYADPATKYVSGFGDRSIENHYPTMTIDELCALPVSDLATKDAVLFVWSTVPQLANTLRIIEAWGFSYVSEWCWDKVDHGTGHWGFNQHEPLLIATRGNFPAPLPGTQPRSLYRERKGEHSEKPAYFAQAIERIWPSLPKIELFSRDPRPGWAAWGNQANQTGDISCAMPADSSAAAMTDSVAAAATVSSPHAATTTGTMAMMTTGAIPETMTSSPAPAEVPENSLR